MKGTDEMNKRYVLHKATMPADNTDELDLACIGIYDSGADAVKAMRSDMSTAIIGDDEELADDIMKAGTGAIDIEDFNDDHDDCWLESDAGGIMSNGGYTQWKISEI